VDLVNLEGKKGLIFGIANENSLAYGIAQAVCSVGAEVGITYLNEKAERYVRPLAEELKSPLIVPCDVQKEGQLEAVFKGAEEKWGKIDFALHAMAYAPLKDLRGRVVDCSLQGWAMAMDISVHSFIRVAKLSEPLMKDGGCLLTLSYFGGDKVIKSYKMMGPVKAALQSATQYLAAELGERGIRVHTISPGPIRTRAASGIDEFERMLQEAAEKAPEHRLADIKDVGAVAAFLISDDARSLTGNLIYVDAGYNIMGD
jgi:enoyl-[acyl-carrier protein] reductase I